MGIETLTRTGRIGIVGTGFIGNGLVQCLSSRQDLQLSGVLTRRDLPARFDFARRDLLTNSIAELVDRSDVIVECSGDVLHAASVVDCAFQAKLPVITMNAEFQVTLGSLFASKGYLTEAEGDQPGCLAALDQDVRQMGFRPTVLGNMKRFLNHCPTPAEMTYWAKKQGIRLNQVTSFTDGTKIQIEQALVANGLGARIAQPGLIGATLGSFDESVAVLAEAANIVGAPISDYVLAHDCPGGVFIVASHDECQRDALRYLKLGDGPDYLLASNYHLCHLEIAKTIRRVLAGEPPLLNNSENPTVGVAAVSKHQLRRGSVISKGIGGFDVRGVAYPISDMPDFVPIGLLDKTIVVRDIEPNTPLSWKDVEVRNSSFVDKLYANHLNESLKVA